LLSADDVIRLLDLKPHPEGGHYRETFRDIPIGASGRAASTAIYFLLKRGERSLAPRRRRRGLALARRQSVGV
jgi:predicted cupin superfamily sugar epimerase